MYRDIHSIMECEPVKLVFTRLVESVPALTQANPGDAGYDLYSTIATELEYGKTQVIPTGCACKIPEGYRGQLKERSSKGIRIRIGAGVIDSGYTGEIKVIATLIDKTTKSVLIDTKKPIAQLVITKLPSIVLEEISNDEFKEIKTERGDKGFGSSDNPSVK